MGNEIAKKYDVSPHHTGLGGNSSLWKIYPAKAKGTGEDVSIFVFKKDEMFPKSMQSGQKEHILNLLRHDLRTLKTLSHPGILRVIHVFDESKKAIAFVAEPVSCSLADLLLIPRNLLDPQAARLAASDLALSAPEKARGAAGLLDALQYLHQVGRRLHCDLTPEAVLVAPTGAWRLAGLGLSAALPEGQHALAPGPFCPDGLARAAGGPVRADPWLRYAAPEVTGAGGAPRALSAKTDLFSLGCLLHDLYGAPGERPGGGPGDAARPFIDLREESVFAHQSYFSVPAPVHLSAEAPADLRELVGRLVQVGPAERPDAAAAAASPAFHAREVAVLRGLDRLPHQDEGTQAAFLSSLMEALPMFPARIHRGTVLPAALAAGRRSPRLWGYALPVVFQVAKQLPAAEFRRAAAPGLREPLAAEQMTPAALYQLAHHLREMLELGGQEFFAEACAPFALRALASEAAPQAQEEAARQLGWPALVKAVPGDQRDGPLMTALCRLAAKGKTTSLRCAALVALAKTFKLYAPATLAERLYPTLRFCTGEEPPAPPAVLMCALGALDAAAQEADAAGLARFVLPAACPLLAAPGLDARQRGMVVARVRELFDRALGEAAAGAVGVAGVGAAGSKSSNPTSSSDPLAQALAPAPMPSPAPAAPPPPLPPAPPAPPMGGGPPPFGKGAAPVPVRAPPPAAARHAEGAGSAGYRPPAVPMPSSSLPPPASSTSAALQSGKHHGAAPGGVPQSASSSIASSFDFLAGPLQGSLPASGPASSSVPEHMPSFNHSSGSNADLQAPSTLFQQQQPLDDPFGPLPALDDQQNVAFLDPFGPSSGSADSSTINTFNTSSSIINQARTATSAGNDLNGHSYNNDFSMPASTGVAQSLSQISAVAAPAESGGTNILGGAGGQQWNQQQQQQQKQQQQQSSSAISDAFSFLDDGIS